MVPEKPYGMTLVEGGAFIMGKQDDDIAQLKNAPAKTVTVRSFYMDETEITNSEYRQFVFWVRDSVALSMLARKADEMNLGEDAEEMALVNLHLKMQIQLTCLIPKIHEKITLILKLESHFLGDHLTGIKILNGTLTAT